MILHDARILTLKRRFIPLDVEENDELFPNGIFEFNITKMLAFIGARPREFPPESVALRDIPASARNGSDEAAIRSADLAKPVILAEISPGNFNLIDGHHRLARARRDGCETLLAVRIGPDQHCAFLTSVKAYRAYVAYWNEKVRQCLGRQSIGHSFALSPGERN